MLTNSLGARVGWVRSPSISQGGHALVQLTNVHPRQQRVYGSLSNVGRSKGSTTPGKRCEARLECSTEPG